MSPMMMMASATRTTANPATTRPPRTSDMPADRFTKKANTPTKKRQWEHVYSSAKKRGASPGSAVRQANATVKRSKKR